MGMVGWILVSWLSLNVAVPLALMTLPRLRRVVRDGPVAAELPGERDLARAPDHVGLDDLLVR